MKEILGTTDRSLALRVGRALEAQRFFHDVNYENRLIDDIIEIYQFNQVLFHSNNNRSASTTSTTSSNSSSGGNSFSVTSTIIGNYASEDEDDDDDDHNSLHTDTTAATSTHSQSYRQQDQQHHSSSNSSSSNSSNNLLLPNGIYTELTHCYTPTCDNIHPCYSYTCPKRERLVKINAIVCISGTYCLCREKDLTV